MRERVRAAPSSTERAHIRHFLFRQFLFTQSGNPEIVLLAGISVVVAKKTAFACEVVKMACEKIGSKVQDENCLLHFNKYSARHALFPQYHL